MKDSKNPVGRPTKYHPSFARVAEELCRRGAIDRELAAAFEVDISTITIWKLKHPAFLAALKVGKEVADDRVERALYQRAIGYEVDTTKVSASEGQVFETNVVEHIAPDTRAATIWLANRRGKNWSLSPTRRVELPLGDFKGSAGLTEAMTGIAKAMAAGAISASEAEAMGRVVDAAGEAYARQVIEERVTALEGGK